MTTFFKLIRLPNLLIVILTQCLTYFCVIKPFVESGGISLSLGFSEFILIVIMSVLITEAGYIINDYYDQDIDSINKPGFNTFNKLNRALLLLSFAVFNLTGIFIGFYLAEQTDTLLMGWFILCIVFILWLYSARYKRQLLTGNILVSLLSAFVVVIVWLFEFFFFRTEYGNSIEQREMIIAINEIILFYASFAFIVSLIREIVKDIEDREGDAEYDCKTLPVVVGVKNSKLVICLLLSAVVLSLLYLQYWHYEGYKLLSWYFVIAVQLPLIFLIYRIIIAESKNNFKYISAFLKIIMLFGIVSMILLRF